MPDIGLIELIIVGLAMFLVLGPERMPEFFAQIARFVRKARNWMNDAKRQLREEAGRVRDPIVQAKETIRGELEQAAETVGEEVARDIHGIQKAGQVLKARPLSEVYAGMQQADGRIDADDTSRGFMQGHQEQAPDEKIGAVKNSSSRAGAGKEQHE